MANEGGAGNKGGAWQVRPGATAPGAQPPIPPNPPVMQPAPHSQGPSPHSASPHSGPPPPVAAPRPAHTGMVPALEPAPVASPSIVKALAASHLFKSFTDTGTQLIGSIAQEKSLPAGTPLFVENMIGEALYVIAAGQIRISARGPDGREHTLVRLDAGDSLGEAALLRTGPRLCSAYAETAIRVVEIARRDIVQLQKTKPQACIKLLMGIVELLAARTKDVDPELKKLISGGA